MKELLTQYAVSQGINRYIMECKSDSQTKSAATTAAN